MSFVPCKTYGHSWDEANIKDAPDLNGWSSRISLRCTRCTTLRFDMLDAAGELGARRYIYPDDYADVKDMKPTRAELRLIIVRRHR